MTLQHWSTLNDTLTAETGNTWIMGGTGGPNYQQLLPAYNNGILLDGAAANAGWWMSNVLPTVSKDGFSFSFLWRPNRTPAANAQTNNFNIGSVGGGWYLSCYNYPNAGEALNFYLWKGEEKFNYVWANTAFTNWVDATSVLKIGVVVEPNAGASQKVRLYENNVLVTLTSPGADGASTGSGNFNGTTDVITFNDTIFTFARAASYFDNFVIWDTLLTDFSYMANEDPEPDAAPTITTTTLSDAIAGTAYSDTCAATGGTEPYVWSISAGAAPTGLSIGSGTGAITGTPSGTSGAYAFTVKVVDAVSQSDTQALSITLANPPTITTTSLDNAPILAAYSTTLAKTGDSPITWNVSAGSLPTGLSLAESTGIISGTPTALGTSNFTARAVNAVGSDTQALSLTIVANPPTITTTTVANGYKNTAYQAQLSATSAVGASTFTWAVSSGTLPTGLTLNTTAGFIGGTPTEIEVDSFTVTATDAGGTDSQALTLTIETQELKDIKVKNGLMARFNQGTECKACFNSIQFGIEGADEIPASKCPALRVALTGLDHNRERYSPVEEETTASYSCFVIVKGTQASETEERLIRAINAVRIDLQGDTTLGGNALDAWSTSVSRERVTDKEPFDVAEIELGVVYLKNPANGY